MIQSNLLHLFMLLWVNVDYFCFFRHLDRIIKNCDNFVNFYLAIVSRPSIVAGNGTCQTNPDSIQGIGAVASLVRVEQIKRSALAIADGYGVTDKIKKVVVVPGKLVNIIV